jgi:hypothetical protein
MGTKEKQKKSRLKRESAVEPSPPPAMAPTTNGRNVQRMLSAAGKKPSEYRDWCIHTTGRLIDWLGTYDIQGGAIVEGALLIHKSKLEPFGEAFARQLWNKTLRRRAHQKNPNSTTKTK